MQNEYPNITGRAFLPLKTSETKLATAIKKMDLAKIYADDGAFATAHDICIEAALILRGIHEGRASLIEDLTKGVAKR